MRIAAGLLSFVAFSAAFAASTAGVRATFDGGDEFDSRREIKFREWAQRRDEFDTLFLGSSRTFRGFDPALFDELTAEAGRPMRAFNFGVPGSRVMEIDRLLERILDLEPEQLRLVIVGPERLPTLLVDENALTRPVIDWHDLERTRLVCTYAIDREPDREKLRAILEPHVIAALYNLIGAGRALSHVDEWLGARVEEQWVLETLGPLRDGFPDKGADRPRGRKFRRNLEGYQELVLEYGSRPLEAGPPAPQALRMFELLRDRADRAGVQLVFVTQSALHLEDDLVKAAEAGLVAPVLRYDDPELVPELYAPDHRFDANHLNTEGARLFTRMLVRDLVPLLEAEERTP